jgi:hypothetical protein
MVAVSESALHVFADLCVLEQVAAFDDRCDLASSIAMADTDVYHVELRQFPHNLCRFNLSAAQLRSTILEGWVRGQWIELGERKWHPAQARLTVLKGPHLSMHQLSMGRGWRAAQRSGLDVTEQLLAEVRGAEGEEAREGSQESIAPSEEDLLADSLGLELLAALGDDGRLSLHDAWKQARKRYPGRSVGECLVLTERAVLALRRSQLVVIGGGMAGKGESEGSQGQPAALQAIASWSDPDGRVYLERHTGSRSPQ